MIKSAYIHIPFCKNICSYCDFCKNLYNEEIVEKYLDSLEKEIKEKYKEEYLNTLYIGGGTPSSLSLKQLEKLFLILKIFKLEKDYEFTFECNYEDITEEFLSLLKNNKVNRLSIGIQSFNNSFKDILNRNIDKENSIKKVLLTKKYFDNINLDLMYAIPGQNKKDLKEDLNLFLNLDISHISTYALIKEPNTKLFIENIKEIDDDTQNEMYYEIVNTLKINGYEHYELSNFSKKGFNSRHNLTYWNNDNYYGFGAGASGFTYNIRYDNTKSIFNYIKGKIILSKEEISGKQDILDYVMLNLRKIKGINLEDFKKRYNIDFGQKFNYDTLLEEGLLEKTNKNLYIKEDKLFISNYIIIKLLDLYLE